MLLYAALTARWPGDPAACALPAAPLQGGRPVRPQPGPGRRPRRAGRHRRPRPRARPARGRAAVHAGRRRRRAGVGRAAACATSTRPSRSRSTPSSSPRWSTPATSSGSPPSSPTTGAPRRPAGRSPAAPARAGWSASSPRSLVASGLWLVGRPAATAAADPARARAGSPVVEHSVVGRADRGASSRSSRSRTSTHPPGNGTENPAQVKLAWDGNPTTAWHTVTYFRRPDLGGLKPGVGLLVDLGSPQTVGAVRLRLVGHGTSVQLRAAAQPRDRR